ncbi:MAG: DUF4825 domain-containing protein [Oscillospiraceae bacterium]|jgi:hypothetical protein|nr:DUF4825 domain-containing protein [Oscillospiraceae bacterium]
MLAHKKPLREITAAAVTLLAVLAVSCAGGRVPITAGSAAPETPDSVVLSPELSPQTYHLPLWTPYVSEHGAVEKIVNSLPSPLFYAYPQPPSDIKLTQRFFSTGDDYGTGFAPNTLTVYYEQSDNEDVYTITSQNAYLLFALIGDLEEVSIAICDAPGGDALDKSIYHTRVTYDRASLGEELAGVGLTWDGLHEDWDASVEKIYALSAGRIRQIRPTSPMAGDLPDFTAMEDAELAQYAAGSDGAYSEGAFYELAQRLSADPLPLLQVLASEDLPGIAFARMGLCKGIAGQYFYGERADELESVLEQCSSMSWPQLADNDRRRVEKIVEALRFQLREFFTAGEATLKSSGKNSGFTASYDADGLMFEVTDVMSARRDAVFDEELDLVIYAVYDVFLGAELRITQAREDGAYPQFRLNYGYAPDSGGNPLIDEPVTVEITKVLRGMLRSGDGYPAVEFRHQW